MRLLYECCQFPTDYKICSNLNWKEKSYFKHKTRYCNKPLGEFILYHEFNTHFPENHKLQAGSLFILKINYEESLTIRH